MKLIILKLIVVLICIIPCVIMVKKSYEPKKIEFNKYLMEIKSCLSIQKEIDKAVSDYGRDKSIFKNVRSDKDFEQIEKQLINDGYLNKNYNKTISKNCLFVIKDGEVCCVCHSDEKQIRILTFLIVNTIMEYIILI